MTHSSVYREGAEPSARARSGEAVACDLSAFGVIGVGSAKAAGLSLRMSAPGLFRVGIQAEDGSCLVELGPFAEDEIVAAWRKLSADSGLPFVVATDEPKAEPLDRTPLPSVERRERLAILAGRRPRFLTRRRVGRLPRHPQVHRAHELAGGSER